jgi:hypothetical protein
LFGAAAFALAVLLAVGCSSAEPTASPETTAAPTTATTAPVGGPAPTQSRQSCAADTLGAAASASFPGPALTDVVCEDKFASATLSNGPGGEFIVLFSLQNGVWTLAGSAPIAEAASAAPADFSPTAVPSWQRTRDNRIARAANPGGKSGSDSSSNTTWTQVNDETGMLEICEQQGDFTGCSAPTFPPPPEDPDAPPTTVKQSGFCKYNFNDPRCVADPGYPG